MNSSPPSTLIPALHQHWHNWNLARYGWFSKKRTIGNASIDPFVVDNRQHLIESLSAALSADKGGRWTPKGSYVRLLKLQSDAHHRYEEPIWQIVMSDTPDEMNDHAEAIANARGRVLIHGLGLGCVLNCIRAKSTVTHIDVVEINEDVLRLITPFFEDDPKITFHLGSCIDIKWPQGTRWNYVWHDIWSTIASHNLTDDSEAEHGISYATLHRKFGRRCDQQGSWAFVRARQKREVDKMVDQIARNFASAWRVSREEDRVEMLIEGCCSLGVPVDVWRQMLQTDTLKGVMERYRQRAANPKMDELEALVFIEQRARRYAQSKVGMI